MRREPEIVQRIASAQAGVVATGQLESLGADRAWIARQVNGGRWQRLHAGVSLTHSGPVLWRPRARAAVLHGGAGATLSHGSAACLHELRAAPPGQVDPTIPHARRLEPVPGVRVHRRTTMPSAGRRPRRTWRRGSVVDLVAGARSDDDAVGWVCDAVRAGTRLLEIADAMTRRGRVCNGALLRDLLHEVAAGIESPLERRYHHDVGQRHGLPGAALGVRQVVDGRWIRADCVYRGLGVRTELDGTLAHLYGRTGADTWRDNAVAIARGEITLRHRWRHVAVAHCATAEQVGAALRLGGWQGNPRPCGPACSIRAQS